jgi:hypothetical protein
MTKADFKILLVDDDSAYAKTWIEKAYDEFFIELVHYEDWESAYTQLNADTERFHAIILDAKGKITPDDSSESMTHILSALQDLKEMEGKGFLIPYVVNTGYIEDSVVKHIKKLKEIKIFSKGNESEMFSYLTDKIKSMPELRIRKKYEQILELFWTDLLPVGYGRKFIDLVSFAENPSWKKTTDDFFTPARKILESVFRQLRDMKKIDDRCFPKNEINLKACIEYLAGNTARIGPVTFTGKRVLPTHIYNSLIFMYEMTGTFSHQYIEDTEVSPYALQSVAMALCEILYWFKSIIEDPSN